MSSTTRILTVAALLAAAAFPVVAQDRDDDTRESYSYVRVLDGQATLASAGSGPGEQAELNQPLMTGDRVSVARGARLEIALADRNLLRVGGDSALTLARIAYSGDSEDRATRIDLDEGEVVLVVTESALGDSLPEIRTPQAEVVIHRPGTFRVETRAEGWTEVVVRDGYAEVVTSRGSTLVREGESAWASDSRRNVDVTDAGPLDSLERWSGDLVRQAERARAAEHYVEPEYSYYTAPLADYGTWISVDSAWYWQPRVEVGWRPYWRGRWSWTPSGLTWVSSEPWGWFPYHYGSWMVLPGHGWCWRPGYVYAPAWVYWNWTDSWVGWVPTGYYTGWYGGGWGYPGFRWGVYGWAGGGWGSYYDWNFCPTRHLRRRDQHSWMRRGHDLERELGQRPPRGVLTTDTRGLPRTRFDEPRVGLDELLRRGRAQRSNGDLPDVSDFVARKRELPPQVVEAVRPDPGARVRLAGDEGATRGFNPRVVPPVAVRFPAGDANGATGGGGLETRGNLPRDGRLFDRESPRTGTPPVATGALPGRPRVNLPPTSVGERPGAGPAGERPPVEVERTPRSGRLEPGGAVEIDRGGRVRPFEQQPNRPPVLTTPRSVPPTTGRSPWSGSEGAPAAGDRQGWRGREGWTGAPGSAGATGGLPAYPAQRYQPRSDEPVQRVLGGVRRYEGGTPQSGATPPSAWNGLPPASSGAVPRWTPRTSSPGTAQPGYVPRSSLPRNAPSGVSPRATPPASPPSRPSASPPSRPSSPRAMPPASPPSRPSASPPSRPSSPPPARSGSPSRQSAPPRRPGAD